MFYAVEPFVVHLRQALARVGAEGYWDEVWQAIQSLQIYATGENYSFQIRPFDEIGDSSSKLFALPIEFEGRWDSISFAQTALEGMGTDESSADFQGTLLAARVEIVKSRLFCIAHHIFQADAGESTAEYRESVETWLKSIGEDRLTYADEEYFKPLAEPAGSMPLGSAKWLHFWLQFRYDSRASPVCIVARVRGDEYDADAPAVFVDRSIILAAAAFAWHDYAIVDDEAMDPTRAAQLAAAAGLALFLALQQADADDEETGDPANWGRAGGIERHRHTRALKDWALAEAARMQGPDRQLARQLAARMPSRFVDVSEDPVRLIYDAIRAKRAEAKGRSGK